MARNLQIVREIIVKNCEFEIPKNPLFFLQSSFKNIRNENPIETKIILSLSGKEKAKDYTGQSNRIHFQKQEIASLWRNLTLTGKKEISQTNIMTFHFLAKVYGTDPYQMALIFKNEETAFL